MARPNLMTREIEEEGTFVVIEGVNATGKTKTIESLLSRLDAESVPVTQFHFPSADADYRLSEMLDESRPMDPPLFITLAAVDRLSNREAIVDKLADGHIVICDRYTPSVQAYGRALGLEGEWLDSLEMPMPNPDFVFVLDVPLDEVRARIQRKSKKDYFESRPELLKKTRDAYRDLVSTTDNDCQWQIISGLTDASDISDEILSDLRTVL